MRCGKSLALASALLLLPGCGDDKKEKLPSANQSQMSTSTTHMPTSSTELSTTTSVSNEHTVTSTSSTSTTTIKRKVSRERTTATNPVQSQPVSGKAVTSTAYCLRGRMANGEQVHNGAVAMNGVPFGTRYRVVETGAIYTVKDRIGHGSQFDIWMASCSAARQYGRRTIHIVRV